MAHVFDLAEQLDARVLLSGDRYQHGSVERGAALRLLEEEAGLVPAEVKEIQRQSGDYKAAVRALAEGRRQPRVSSGSMTLGWIREIPQDERYKQLAADYVAAVAEVKRPWSFRRRMPKGIASPPKSARPCAKRASSASDRADI